MMFRKKINQYASHSGERVADENLGVIFYSVAIFSIFNAKLCIFEDNLAYDIFYDKRLVSFDRFKIKNIIFSRAT